MRDSITGSSARARARARACAGVALLACSANGALEAQVEAPLALVGGSVYAAPEQAPLEDAVVLVDGGRIVAVGARGSTPVPRWTRVIDCTGLTAVAEARRRGKPVFVHPTSGADVLAAVRAGVDVVALTPTLLLWREVLRSEPASLQQQALRTALDQLRAWLAAGGGVLFGTDLGAVHYDPTEEYELMAAAGMTFAQILASLTTAPAERFGASEDAGRVAVGSPADLVVLAGDPAEDIRALADVRYTLRGGRVIHARR